MARAIWVMKYEYVGYAIWSIEYIGYEI